MTTDISYEGLFLQKRQKDVTGAGTVAHEPGCFKCNMRAPEGLLTFEHNSTTLYIHDKCLIELWVHWEKFRKLREYWDDIMK